MEFIDDKTVELRVLFPQNGEAKFGLAMKSRVATNVLWLTKSMWAEIKGEIDGVVNQMVTSQDVFEDPDYVNPENCLADFRFHQHGEEDLT